MAFLVCESVCIVLEYHFVMFYYFLVVYFMFSSRFIGKRRGRYDFS